MADYDTLTGLPSAPLIPERTALLVIDMQRYFVQPEFPFGQLIQQRNPAGANAYFQRVRELVIPNIQRLLEQGRVHGLCIAYTESGSLRHDGRDLPGWMRRHNDRSRRTMGTVTYPRSLIRPVASTPVWRPKPGNSWSRKPRVGHSLPPSWITRYACSTSTR
jgi:nicotinamidase-related amidase